MANSRVVWGRITHNSNARRVWPKNADTGKVVGSPPCGGPTGSGPAVGHPETGAASADQVGTDESASESDFARCSRRLPTCSEAAYLPVPKL